MSEITSRVSAHPLSDAASFSVIRDFLLVPLFDNFDEHDIEVLESRVLHALFNDRRLRGALFNCSDITTSDGPDLLRLQGMLKAIRLVGGRVGICGINPGLAMLIIRTGLKLEGITIAADLDDLIKRLDLD